MLSMKLAAYIEQENNFIQYAVFLKTPNIRQTTSKNSFTIKNTDYGNSIKVFIVQQTTLISLMDIKVC